MLYGISDDPDDNPDLERMFLWFEVVYRFSTYAMISFGFQTRPSTIRSK